MNRRNRQHRKQSQHHRAAKPVNQQQQQQLSPNSTLKRRNLALRSSHPQTGQATSVFASKERGERVSLLFLMRHLYHLLGTYQLNFFCLGQNPLSTYTHTIWLIFKCVTPLSIHLTRPESERVWTSQLVSFLEIIISSLFENGRLFRPPWFYSQFGKDFYFPALFVGIGLCVFWSQVIIGMVIFLVVLHLSTSLTLFYPLVA